MEEVFSLTGEQVSKLKKYVESHPLILQPKENMIPITSEQYANFVLSMQKLQAVKAIVDAWTSFNAEADVILAVQKIVE